jgi:hypothetical protein
MAYDIDWILPFSLGINLETLALVLNIGIPIIYFLNFGFLYGRLKKFDSSAPYYAFVKSLVYFFFFYGLGALFFVWYDFFYMNFESPDPIAVFNGEIDTPPNQVLQLWKIGILLQNIGLVLMINELRGKIFTGKWKNWLPIIWEAVGISFLITLGLVSIPIISENAYFIGEINFLFNFTWSITLPLTYGYIYKHAPGNLRKYAFMLFFCFLMYGIAWGFRTRFAVSIGIDVFSSLDPNPMNYTLIWIIRSSLIIINLGMVLYAYRHILDTSF